MGEVWLAEQKNPVRRRVATKLIKAGLNAHQKAVLDRDLKPSNILVSSYSSYLQWDDGHRSRS